MPYVSSKRLLIRAMEKGCSIGAFNVENMEMAQAVVWAAEAMESPVILQTTPSTLKYASPPLFFAMIHALADAASIPVSLHLDHGNSFELACLAVRSGYSSVMIDGSGLPFEQNIGLTRKTVEMCHPMGIPVEAELGKVGGKEDDLVVNSSGYTDSNDAVCFVKETGADTLAIAIGTAHGVYAGTPKLDLARLSEIRAAVEIPLVLHGASGISDDVLRECIERGISKINFATELRQAYTLAVREALDSDAKAFDVKVFGDKGRTAVKRLAMEKIAVCLAGQSGSLLA